MPYRERSSETPGRENSAPTSGAPPHSGVPLVGAGIAPVAPDQDRSAYTGGDAPRGRGDFQKRVQEEVEHSLQEHPDGSAPPLDRLTQDLDPNKDL